MKRFQLLLFSLLATGIFVVIFNVPAPSKVAAQQPTGSVATVTGTPSGVIVTVTYEDKINVRSGPGTRYPAIGVLLPAQTAPALGKSPAGEWVQISYPGVPGDVGWVYAAYVRLSFGKELPIVEPPPTATVVAPTIDPTLAARFIPEFTPTRLPTFTAPAPVARPTYVDEAVRARGVPMGLVIGILVLIGGFGALISFLRGR
jgi:hypothetical protein